METEPQNSIGKYIGGIIIIAFVIIGASYWGNKTKIPSEKTPVDETPKTETVDNLSTEIATTTNNVATTSPKTIEVTYTTEGFTPTSVTIKSGNTVKFVNKTADPMWVASDEHPTHTLYARTSLKEHCPDAVGAAFDQCARDNEYSFTFNKIGEWTYHNHSNPSKEGKIIVTE